MVPFKKINNLEKLKKKWKFVRGVFSCISIDLKYQNLWVRYPRDGVGLNPGEWDSRDPHTLIHFFPKVYSIPPMHYDATLFTT
jgi:hypothetical protein